MAIVMNLLQIVQTACAEMGIQIPAVVVGSTDLQTTQIYALVNRVSRELQQEYDWTALQVEYDLNVTQPIVTAGDIAEGSYQITNIPSTLGLSPQLFVVNGQFLPTNTRLVSVDSLTQVTISQPATGTFANTPLTFAQDTYPEPGDFDRFINETWWDRTNRWALIGPDSPQIDQWHRSGVVTIGPRRHFRQIGAIGEGVVGFSSGFSSGFNSFNPPLKNYRLWPPPGTNDTPINLVFEYISQNYVLSINGTPQASFLADTDFTVLDPHAIILGTKAEFFRIKGWDYASMQQEYVDYVNRKYSNDGGNKTLNMATSRYGVFISPSNVPDGGWPGPIGTG